MKLLSYIMLLSVIWSAGSQAGATGMEDVAQTYCECDYNLNPFMKQKWVLNLVILRSDGSEIEKPLEYFTGTILDCESAMAEHPRCN